MKAISLWQPWAELIALKIKKIETRGWYTDYRGGLLICSSKTKNWEFEGYYYWLFKSPELLNMKPAAYQDLPRGFAVAKTKLVDCKLMDKKLIDKQSHTEISCGDWKPGRYAWFLEDIEPVTPFPVRGQQRLFEVEYNG